MTYWASHHQCVSCEYWDGERAVKSDSRVVECKVGTKGTCMGPNRMHRGRQVDCGLRTGSGCYQQWRYVHE